MLTPFGWITVASFICNLIVLFNVGTFVINSKILGVYYMPSKKFAKIIASFLLSAILLILQNAIIPLKVNLLGHLLVMVAGSSVGYFIGIFGILYKDQIWPKDATPMKFLNWCVIVYVLMILYQIYVAYQLSNMSILTGTVHV